MAEEKELENLCSKLKNQLFELMMDVDKCSVYGDRGKMRRLHYRNMSWLKENGLQSEYADEFYKDITSQEKTDFEKEYKGIYIRQVDVIKTIAGFDPFMKSEPQSLISKIQSIPGVVIDREETLTRK